MLLVFGRYLEAIVKQKKISDMATQQLLLDTYSIKTLLLHLPNLNPGEKEASVRTSPVYAKLINAKVAHVEVILKLVGTPEDMLLERFRIMWPDGQPVDLQMLMGLKGTKRSDQQVLLEMFGLSSSKANKQQQAAASSADASQAGNNFSTTTSAAAASAAASAAAFSSSMKSLTQDLSSQARNAVGNLKWTTNK